MFSGKLSHDLVAIVMFGEELTLHKLIGWCIELLINLLVVVKISLMDLIYSFC